jgi:peptide/nickel transport system substrate-binding protein
MHPLSAHKSTLPNVTGAKKVDALTVDLLTSQPTPVLPLALSNLRLMSKAWCEKNKAEKPQDYKAKEETFAARNAVGTGPFKLVRWETDVKTVFAANEGYWGKKGNVTEATFFVVGSAATRVAAIITGEMDFVIDPAYQDLERLKREPQVKLTQGGGLGAQFMGFDHAREKLNHGDAGGKNPFKDARVREAFRLAIDTDALKVKVMRNAAMVGRSLYTSSVDGLRQALPAAPDPTIRRARRRSSRRRGMRTASRSSSTAARSSRPTRSARASPRCSRAWASASTTARCRSTSCCPSSSTATRAST